MDILVWKYLHLLCLVYWLGGDLGTFIAGRSVLNEKLSAEARVTAIKILLACDQGPRFAMPLTLPSGLQLAYTMGILQVDSWVMTIIWALALLWLGLVVALHFWKTQLPALAGQVDWYVRCLICLTCLLYGLASIPFDTAVTASWAAVKLVFFSITVLMGLMIRKKLIPLMAVYGDLVANNVTEKTNAGIRKGIVGATPYVKVIWLVLFINTAIGLHILM